MRLLSSRALASALPSAPRASSLRGLLHLKLQSQTKFSSDLDCAKFILFSGEIGELNFGRLIKIENISFDIRSSKPDYKKMELFRGEFIRWFPSASYSEFLKNC